MTHTKSKLIRESHHGTLYEYYPMGQHIVAAPGVCGGRPTFKYSRLEVATVLDLHAAGWTAGRLVQEYAQSRLSSQAVAEALQLAKEGLVAVTTIEQHPG